MHWSPGAQEENQKEREEKMNENKIKTTDCEINKQTAESHWEIDERKNYYNC